jgi:uncharacterized protein YjbI with pentapeptide repeats
MSNHEHLKILWKGAEKWNQWRKDNPEVIPDLSEARLKRANLSGTDLTRANLVDADLRRADLTGASLKSADLSGADLRDVLCSKVDFDPENPGTADFSSTATSR